MKGSNNRSANETHKGQQPTKKKNTKKTCKKTHNARKPKKAWAQL